jgi:hypothetical protein
LSNRPWNKASKEKDYHTLLFRKRSWYNSNILALSLRKEVFSMLELITLLVVIRVVLPLAYELGKAYGMKWIEKRFDDNKE